MDVFQAAKKVSSGRVTFTVKQTPTGGALLRIDLRNKRGHLRTDFGVKLALAPVIDAIRASMTSTP